MRQQCQTAALVEDRQIVSKCCIIAKRQIGFPFCGTLDDQLGHHAVFEGARLRRHVDPTYGGFEPDV